VFAIICAAVGGHDRNSDETISLLQASDILHGNFFSVGLVGADG